MLNRAPSQKYGSSSWGSSPLLNRFIRWWLTALVILTSLAMALPISHAKRSKGLHTFKYLILPGDTLWHISRRFKISVEQIRGWNPKVDPEQLKPGIKLLIRSRVPRRGRRKRCVQVQAGDSLWKLSRRLGVKVNVLRRFNNIQDSKRLQINQLLCYYLHLPEKESRAVGKPQSGRLIDGEQLQEGPGYYVKRPKAAYGSNELVTLVYSCLSKISTPRSLKKGTPLIIGDLSRKGGGPLPQHCSHQNGTDIDFGYYYQTGTTVPTNRFISRPNKIDLARTWSMLQCLLDSGEVQYVFMDMKVQRLLYRYAQKHRRYPAKDLRSIFEYGAGRPRRSRNTIILHSPNHLDHYHVRIFCPRGDVLKGRRGCISSPGRGRVVMD